MMDDFIKTFKETTMVTIPICIIVVILCLCFGIEFSVISSFVISSFLLIIGISLFTFGADISMVHIGEVVGAKLVESKKVFLIVIATLIIGFIITLAEPDLKVLADQISTSSSTTMILFVSIGVGICLMIGTLKTLFKLSFRTILIILYTFTFALLCFKPEIASIAFDSSGVTTGPISAPFILALGIGLTSFRTDSNSKSDTFGLIGLCSVGPKIAVIILSMIYGTVNSFDTSIYLNNDPLIIKYVDTFITCFKDVFISISPIIALFIIFKLFVKNSFNYKQTKRTIFGLVCTFTGLCLFLTGVDAGFMQTGFLLGLSFANSSYINLLFLFAVLIGFLVVFAEPAIKILTSSAEEITDGSISKNVFKFSISLGVSIFIFISIYRMINGYSIIPFLVLFYGVSLLLTFISPKMFTALAFDAGGSVCGPITASFLLPLIIGVCYTIGGNIFTDAFGFVSFIALSPFITVQILGIIFKVKTKATIYKNINEEIVDYDWRSAL